MDNILYPGIGNLIVILMLCNYTVNVSKKSIKKLVLDRICQMMKILQLYVEFLVRLLDCMHTHTHLVLFNPTFPLSPSCS